MRIIKVLVILLLIFIIFFNQIQLFIALIKVPKIDRITISDYAFCFTNNGAFKSSLHKTHPTRAICCYSDAIRTIYLKPYQCTPKDIRHEIGHAVSKELNIALSDGLLQALEQDCYYKGILFIEEYWADVYASYFTNKDKCKDEYPNGYEFINNLYKGG